MANRPTHCPKGHPYVEGNITWGKVLADGVSRERKCAACLRICNQKNKARYRWKDRNDPERKRIRAAQNKAYRQRYPEKIKARSAVAIAVKKGTLVRPTVCDWCGKPGRIQASHNNYDRPLEVEWLCQPCHGLKDRKLKAVPEVAEFIVREEAS